MTHIIKFFLCGIIASFLFPPFFILPLGFLVFPYLYFVLKEKKKQRTSKFSQFVFGVAFGLGLNLIVLYWVREPFSFNPVTKNYASLSFLLTFYISIYFGFAFLILSFFKNDFSKMIMIPVVFVIAEIIREKFLFGFPWITFAVIASGNYYLLQVVYFVGTNGLSFILILLFLVPASIFLLKENRTKFFSKIYLIFSFSMLFFISTLIFIKLNFLNDQDTNIEMNFSLNQLNISQSDKLNNQFKEDRVKEIIKIIKNRKNTIHVFSETDYPYIIENNNIVNILQKYLSNNNSIIIGGIRKDEKKYYNSLYFITKNYFKFFDKKRLVPFGEFLPFRNKLNFLEFFVGSADFERGKKDRLIETDYHFNFIPVICYEIIFFNDLLSEINQMSPIIINITNDAWFGRHSGPYQHFYLSRIRSTEFNKFLIRLSNNGVSAIIDNYGKIISYIPLNKKEIEYLKINIPSELNNLFYFHKLIYLVLIIVTIIAVTIEKRIEKLQPKI